MIYTLCSLVNNINKTPSPLFFESVDFGHCRACRNLFPVCQTIGLADVDNVSDLSNICRTYIFFTTSTYTG